MLGYLPGTLFAAYDQVLIFAFYARQNTWTPVLVGIGAIGVYFVVALALVNSLGMLGLVLANSAQFVAHALVTYWLARQAFGAVGGSWLRRVGIPCLGAGIGMAVLCLAIWVALENMLPEGDSAVTHLARELVLVGVPVAVGGAVYVAVLHRRGLEEIAVLRQAIVAKVAPRLAS